MSTTVKTLGFTALKTYLRHSHPMIYLDRILDYEPNDYLQALVNISGNMDCIAGHSTRHGETKA